MQSGKEDPPKGLAGCIIYGGHSHFPMYTEANIAKFVFELVKGKYLYAPCAAERNKRRKRGLSSCDQYVKLAKETGSYCICKAFSPIAVAGQDD